MIRRLFYMFVALFALTAPAMAQPAECMARCTQGSHQECRAHCINEGAHWFYTIHYFAQQTDVDPTEHGACNILPEIQLWPNSQIKLRCNQNPNTGRDMHSCSASKRRGGFVILLDADEAYLDRMYWYRYQMGKFYYWCTGLGVRTWPWWSWDPFGPEDTNKE